ncbi:DUF6178 family protein [Geomonas sp. RF6]|uniref:DUF6178 family protein n=1 Tax=Geomonas sp. RF6 TaxID=2897342 RepID=UPI001E47F6B6|nr:DUF6178 family protein [Geomonas sp. RF6]UFS71294.1 DUF6178 family protein [Geomonas sp. RF6]
MVKAEKKKLHLVKNGDRDIAGLPFAEKQARLRDLTGKRKMDVILTDPDARRLTAAMQPQELYRLIKGVGEEDALELIELASGPQCVFMLDMELWDGYNFSDDRAHKWLTYFVEGGEARFHELLKHLDFEFLLLFLSRELVVHGGIGDLAHDEERLVDHDFTFDDVFYLTFKNQQHSQVVGAFLSLLIKVDRPLYVSLMEEVKGSLDVELEEESRRFRDGRLHDLGFPPLEEALSIYSRVDPASFRLFGDKEELSVTESTALVPVSLGHDTLLYRALSRAGSEALLQEFNYLVNSALVAEGTALADIESATSVMERVAGYLNIALEQVSGGDEGEAVRVLSTERLKRLFQLGYSLVLELKFRADQVESTDYPSGKAIAGLRGKRPRYYRGFDPDGVDGYREFRDLNDLRAAVAFLKNLQG